MSGLFAQLKDVLSQAAISGGLASQFLDRGIPIKITSLGAVQQAAEAINDAFPEGTIAAYAMKSDPRKPLLRRVLKSGLTVEVNSIGELKAAEKVGFDPRAIIFSTPQHLAYDNQVALEHGVTLFVSQSEQDIQNLANASNGKAKVIVRLLSGNDTGSGFDIDGAGNQPPRYGVTEEEAVKLLVKCRDLAITPYGVCGHVGTQVRKPEAWDNLIKSAASVDKILRDKHNITLEVFDVGGGFPLTPANPAPAIEVFANHIKQKVDEAFGNRNIQLIVEPGTYISNQSIFLGTVIAAERRENQLYVTTTLGRYNAGILGDDNPIVGVFHRNKDGSLVSREGANESATFFGQVTANSDRWANPVEIPNTVQAGDYVILRGGAYSGPAKTKWSLHEQPREYFLREDRSLEGLFKSTILRSR